MGTATAPVPPARPRIARDGAYGGWTVEVTTPGGPMLFRGETIEEALESAVDGLAYFLYHPTTSSPPSQELDPGGTTTTQ